MVGKLERFGGRTAHGPLNCSPNLSVWGPLILRSKCTASTTSSAPTSTAPVPATYLIVKFSAMDYGKQDKGDRKRFPRLRIALTPKARQGQSAKPAILPLTGSATVIETSSNPASSTASLLTTQAPNLPADDSERLYLMDSGVLPDESPGQQTAGRLDPSGDRERTERRYREAVEQFQKSVKLPRKNWETFVIPDFKNLADVNDPIPQLREDIKKTLDARNNAFKNPNFWSKSKRITEEIFTAISPFVKNVLFVAKEGSSVFRIENFFSDLVDAPVKSVWLAMWWTTSFDYGILNLTSF